MAQKAKYRIKIVNRAKQSAAANIHVRSAHQHTPWRRAVDVQRTNTGQPY